MKNFAVINFRGEPLSKDFTGIKKGENRNLREETFVLLYCVKVGHLTCVKITKKEIFKKLEFLYECHNNLILLLQKCIFFRIFADDDFFRKFRGKKLSRMIADDVF